MDVGFLADIGVGGRIKDCLCIRRCGSAVGRRAVVFDELLRDAVLLSLPFTCFDCLAD